MQILESSVTTEYSDGSKKTRVIEGKIPPEGKKDFRRRELIICV